MPSSERLFWDNVAYHASMTGKRAKPRNRGFLRFMKAEVVLKELERLGIKTTERTLQRYVKDELIPMPYRKSVGRGKGKVVDYQDETSLEFAASYILKNGPFKCSSETTRRARSIAIQAEGEVKILPRESGNDHYIVDEAFYYLVSREGKMGDITVAQDGNYNISPIPVGANPYNILGSFWLQSKIKAKAGFNPGDEDVLFLMVPKQRESENEKTQYIVSVCKFN